MARSDGKSQALEPDELRVLRLAGEWGMLRDLSGWKVCMTGASSMRREDLAVLIEAAGGTWTNTMSGTVKLLIAPADDAFTAKVQKAEATGVRVMSEHDFVAALLPDADDLLAGRRRRFLTDQLSLKPVK